MGITEYTFDNGLKLVYQRRKTSNLSAISLFCRVGSTMNLKDYTVYHTLLNICYLKVLSFLMQKILLKYLIQ